MIREALFARPGLPLAARHVLMGLMSFLWRPARTAVADVVTVLNSTSVFVWIVVSLIWFGLGDLAPIFTTFMITLPVVGANVVEGVESVDRRLLEMGQVYRLSGWEKFRAIVIPSTIPHLVAGMKVGFGLAPPGRGVLSHGRREQYTAPCQLAPHGRDFLAGLFGVLGQIEILLSEDALALRPGRSG